MRKLLIANRGEIAIRVARAAASLGLASAAIYAQDDETSLHVRRADEAVPLGRRGPAAYLDVEAVVAAARAVGADAVHPGYGFLSENAAFARACAAAGLVFIGPRPETLELFGDKAKARAFAAENGVPIPPGTRGPTSLADAAAFMAEQDGAAVMVKAIAGGGGRGMRVVARPEDLEAAFARCRSEAQAAFGSGDLYVERLIGDARHVEVQVIGDRHGAVTHLRERECTLQRRHQKLVEVAPSPSLSDDLRDRVLEAAVSLARAAAYEGLGTVEFLVEPERDAFHFMEANPRLQVEHTVTEQTLGLDLVAAQIRVAGGATLAELGLAAGARREPRGYAVQVRVNLETMDGSGEVRPAGGRLAAYDRPRGPASGSITTATPATGRRPRSTRSSPRSSSTRRTRSMGRRCAGPSGRSPSSASRGLARTSRSCARCSAIPTSWRTGSTRASSRRTPPRSRRRQRRSGRRAFLPRRDRPRDRGARGGQGARSAARHDRGPSRRCRRR